MTLPADLNAKTIELVPMQAMDDYIEKHLGRPWKLQQNEMLSNDTLRYYFVKPNYRITPVVQAWLDSPPCVLPGRMNQGDPVTPGMWPGAPANATVGETAQIDTSQILDELCNRELLTEGVLYVHVWW